MKNILIFILALCFGQVAFAQTLEQYEEKATEAYNAQKWSKSFTYHDILLEIDSNRVDARFYGGHSAYNIRSYETARALLTGIPPEQRTGSYQMTDFLLGNVFKGLEDYGTALMYYQKFLAAEPVDAAIYTERAARELDYCEWAAEQIGNPASTEIIHLDSNINTIYTDISPFVNGNELYYATGAVTTDARRTKDRVAIVKTVDDMNRTRIDMQAGEAEMNVANYQMNDTEDRLVYTVCAVGGGEENYDCKIYQMRKQTDGSWGGSALMNEKINMSGYKNTQPALGRNENGSELLFFSSNRPGGKGGMDIWCSVITEAGDISVPINIPEVNSALHDVTPFFHSGSQNLYFSSEGFKSMGGYDIYASQKSGTNWAAPENLGYPTNGGYDEMYYTFDDASGNAHFVSNRPGGLCENPEKDCVINDIYRIPITVDLEALVFNGVDDSDLFGTTVELMNLSTGTVDTFYMNEVGNDFKFPLLLGQDYRLTATKDGFSVATQDLTTKGIYTTTTLKEKLVLTPAINLEVLTFDLITGNPLGGTTIYLTDESIENAENIQRTPLAETENQANYTIAFGHSYNVYAEKIGYTTSEVLSFNTIGLNTPTTIVKKLYLRPDIGLPITVYFDNDYPNPRSRATVCDKTYDVTFDRYIQQKTRFQNGFASGLTGNAAAEAKAEVAAFFDYEVQKGYDTLNIFTDRLIEYFKSGAVDTLVIELQGYASPLAKTDYNALLTARRTDSVENHFEEVNNRELLPYIQSGRLKFIEVPNGEEYSDPTVTDAPNNRRKSVFSPAASRERRVRILDVKRKDGMIDLR